MIKYDKAICYSGFREGQAPGIKYPDYEKHKIEHDTIMEELNSFVKQLPDFEENLFERELIRILDTSLIDHIIKEDTKITDWEKINLAINKK